MHAIIAGLGFLALSIGLGTALKAGTKKAHASAPTQAMPEWKPMAKQPENPNPDVFAELVTELPPAVRKQLINPADILKYDGEEHVYVATMVGWAVDQEGEVREGEVACLNCAGGWFGPTEHGNMIKFAVTTEDGKHIDTLAAGALRWAYVQPQSKVDEIIKQVTVNHPHDVQLHLKGVLSARSKQPRNGKFMGQVTLHQDANLELLDCVVVHRGDPDWVNVWMPKLFGKEWSIPVEQPVQYYSSPRDLLLTIDEEPLKRRSRRREQKGESVKTKGASIAQEFLGDGAMLPDEEDDPDLLKYE